MKFLVDAQLPRRFANWLNDAGHDALHTLEPELGKLLRANMPGIEAAFASSRFVEITRDALVVHE